VREARRIEGKVAAIGRLSGDFMFGRAVARVPSDRRRDTERNHTGTHLLHAALRSVLGEHVHQAGSLVAPDRLRFDFTHHGPIRPEQLRGIESRINDAIFAAIPVEFEERPYSEAVAAGAMALFGEKYGDIVRVVRVPGVSVELCGGTHVRNTSEIGLLRIVSETGVAAGQRRIEALSGKAAFQHMREAEQTLSEVADLLKAPVDRVLQRARTLVDERRALEKRVEELRSSAVASDFGGGSIGSLMARPVTIAGVTTVVSEISARDLKELQAAGDIVRERLRSGIGVLAGLLEDGRTVLLVVVTDDLRERGLRADTIVREMAALGGGKGGGKPHMAQAGIPDSAAVRKVLDGAAGILDRIIRAAA
jgi:alanyl-tRNA synthetase